MGAAILPRSKAGPYANADGSRQTGSFLKGLVVVVCCLNAYFCITSLRPSCPPVRQLLSTSTAAAAATAASFDASTEQHLPGQQQEGQALMQAGALSGSCPVKVEDISSWANAGLNDPPFAFPKIIHQTVEDKSNVSCESLACMQTWMDMNPGYEHRLVDAKDRHEFVATHYPEVRERQGERERGGSICVCD